MKQTVGALLSSMLCLAATPCLAEPLPEPIRLMVENALSTNDPATIAAVIAIARKTAPDGILALDAIAADYHARVGAEAAAKEKAERERIASASLLSLWTGEVELGGSRSTGNSRTLGLYGSGTFTRTGIRVTQKFTARADYQRTNGTPTTERIVAAYQPRYRLDADFYVYGLGQYEHDRFLGYRTRLTTATGLGVTAASRSDFKLDFELGPAFRHTEFYEMDSQSRIAARGSLSGKWLPSPTLTLAQDASLYLQRGNTTAVSTTSLETRLFGPVKGRVSYNVQYEGDAPEGQKKVDTVSRASLVYNF